LGASGSDMLDPADNDVFNHSSSHRSRRSKRRTPMAAIG
jgi:hypothetical protein